MTRTTIRLLLVEDDPSDAEIVTEALSQSRRPRFQVIHAARLRTAHDLLAESEVDAALLDLGLPDSQGIGTCADFLAAHPDVPCIVLTGLEDDELGVEAVRRGAQDFVVKDRPAPEVLARSIRYAIERHAMLARLERAGREAKASETRFRELIARSSEGILVLDGDLTVRFANPAAAALLRRAADELLGTRLPGTIAGKGAREITVERPDGTSFPADVRVANLDWDGGAARLVSLYDLSDRKRTERVALAQAIQRAFLPERMEVRRGLFELSGSNALCEDASGDFYDFVELGDGRISVAVGDVTGHGLGPALLMAQGRASLRAFCRTLDDLPAVRADLSDARAADMTQGRFMTLFAAMLDPHSGSVAWCNAGHVPALLLRARSRVVERLEATGLVLGIVPGAAYAAGRALVLGPQDVLLVYSDGATEAANAHGRRFGEARIAEILRAEGPHGVDALVRALRAAIEAWTRGRPVEDDLTLLAVRRLDFLQEPGLDPDGPPFSDASSPAREAGGAGDAERSRAGVLSPTPPDTPTDGTMT